MVFKNLEEAVEELVRDPSRPVRAHVRDLDVELRAMASPEKALKLGDYLASLGPWEGESPEELLRRLREAREAGGSAEPPAL